jgi:hypothetical protein
VNIPLVALPVARKKKLGNSIPSVVLLGNYFLPGAVTHNNWLPEHTLGSGQGSNVSGLGTDIVDNGGLDPGDDKVSSFVVDLLLDTKDTGVLDGTVTSVD